jgi:hypothetical protein
MSEFVNAMDGSRSKNSVTERLNYGDQIRKRKLTSVLARILDHEVIDNSTVRTTGVVKLCGRHPELWDDVDIDTIAAHVCRYV